MFVELFVIEVVLGEQLSDEPFVCQESKPLQHVEGHLHGIVVELLLLLHCRDAFELLLQIKIRAEVRVAVAVLSLVALFFSNVALKPAGHLQRLVVLIFVLKLRVSVLLELAAG